MSEKENHVPIRITEQMMIQYLLGELSEAWKARFEEYLFADPDCYEQLQIVEEGLIDDYVRGRLNPERRFRFETHYLISERRRQKVAFVRTMIRAIADLPTSTHHESSNRWQSVMSWLDRLAAPRLALAGLALLISIGGTWLAIEMARLRIHQAQMETELAALRHSEPASQTASQPQLTAGTPSPNAEADSAPTYPKSSSRSGVPSHSAAITYTLEPGRTRDAEAQPGRSERADLISIAHGTRRIRLRLMFEDAASFQSFRATLMRAEGQMVSLPGNLRLKPGSDGNTIVVDLPARLLARGDYVLTLLGVTESGETEELGDFYFAVQRH